MDYLESDDELAKMLESMTDLSLLRLKLKCISSSRQCANNPDRDFCDRHDHATRAQIYAREVGDLLYDTLLEMSDAE